MAQAAKTVFNSLFGNLILAVALIDELWTRFDAPHAARAQLAFDTETPFNPYAPAFGTIIGELDGGTILAYTGRNTAEDVLPSGAKRQQHRMFFKYGAPGSFSKNGATLTITVATLPDGTQHNGGQGMVALNVWDTEQRPEMVQAVGQAIAQYTGLTFE